MARWRKQEGEGAARIQAAGWEGWQGWGAEVKPSALMVRLGKVKASRSVVTVVQASPVDHCVVRGASVDRAARS